MAVKHEHCYLSEVMRDNINESMQASSGLCSQHLIC